MKRTRREVMKQILKALQDGKPRSYGYLERKVNTNWNTIRDHIKDLELFDAVEVEDKITITSTGRKTLNKLKK